MNVRRRPPLAALLTISTLGLAVPARAQVNAAVGLDSDDRLRGLSISDGKPVLNASVGYDHPSGVYLGASVAGQPGSRLVGYSGYLGYASRRTTAVSWDVGVDDQYIVPYAAKPSTFHYTEIYAGLNVDHFSSHLYYSPNYLSPGANSLYIDLAAAYRPWTSWRVFGHVGALSPLGEGGRVRVRESYDALAGIARAFNRVEVHLSWTATSPAQARSASQNSTGLVLGASYFF